MSLTRQTQKVFGSNANANQLAVFGSMKTGTPIYSTNLSTLQSTAYTQGWSEALLNDKAPYMEEMNAVQYGLSYQIAYMLQEGAFAYDANTTYSSTSIVKAFENGKMYFYHSLIDNNQGHALSDSTYWEKINISDTRNIGEIVQSAIPLTDAGLHLLDGSLLSGSGSYGAFVTYIAGLYTADPTANYFTTEANWQTSVSTYGVCGKFVYDSANNTVRLPKYSNKIYTQDISSSAPVIGNGNTLGLSNGVTNFGMVLPSSTVRLAVSNTMGTLGTSAAIASTGDTTNVLYGVTTNPTKSGLVADIANITTSLEGYYYIVVATSTKTNIQVDIDEIATDLNEKADVDLTNAVPTSAFATALNDVDIVTIVESFVDGTEWYNVYSNGFCEQGGVTASANTLIDLYKEYKDTNYSGQATVRDYVQQSATQTEGNPRFNIISTTQCFVSSGNVGKVAQWVARGYIS